MMVLEFLGEEEESLFPHNRDYGEGIRERGIREGQATVVVALDGSGDAESVQEGIKMLPSTGGVVYVKNGVYEISDTITFGKANVTLFGTGRATQIKLKVALADNSSLIDMQTNSYVTVESVYINGNNLGTSTDGIRIGNATGCIVRNCYVENCTDIGIIANAVTTSDIFTLITGNIIKDCEHGILLLNSSKCVVSGNHSYSNNGIGIAVQNSGSTNPNSVIVSNNVCALNGNTAGDHGILLTECDNCIIEGNVCIGNLDNGIFIQAHPVTAATCNQNIVANNNCTGNDDGIVIDTNCSRTLVHGNMLYTNTTANLTNNGATTTLADNVTA